jgi:hypothetical protein
MTTTPSPSLMDGIRQGIEAAGRALLDEARRTGRPLATCRDGRVVLVNADGVEAEDDKDGHARQ